MSDVKWLPFIPHYPNVQIPYTPILSEIRVVEPSTRSSIHMNLMEYRDQQLEKYKQIQGFPEAVIRYTSDGKRVLTTHHPDPMLIDIRI